MEGSITGFLCTEDKLADAANLVFDSDLNLDCNISISNHCMFVLHSPTGKELRFCCKDGVLHCEGDLALSKAADLFVTEVLNRFDQQMIVIVHQTVCMT